VAEECAGKLSGRDEPAISDAWELTDGTASSKVRVRLEAPLREQVRAWIAHVRQVRS